jgi:YidC/Oxa1 family membrane protein insertase
MDRLVHAFVFANFLGDFFRPLINGLQWLLETFESWAAQVPFLESIGSWGIAIIMLTMLVRTLMLPLTIKQYKSQASMAALQPKIKALQKKYKKDRAKLQEETMKLYREYQVNPFASCLPLFIQMPIFLCLYYAIRGEKALQLGNFLWIKAGEVTSQDPYTFIHGLGNPDKTYILFALYIITQMVSTELMMSPETEKQQKMIMRAMPIFFGVILYRFPSGLFVYWVTTNIWTIGQQLIIRRRIHKPGAELAPPGPKKESRFMRALTEAQDKQKQRGEEGKRRLAKLKGEDDEVGGDDDEGDDDGGSAPAKPAGAGGSGASSNQRAKGQKGRQGGSQRKGGQGGAQRKGGQGPSKQGAKGQKAGARRRPQQGGGGPPASNGTSDGR